ncbi:TPA: hypothetical protein SB533_001742 [Campylobacter coli]|uniref:hypothetical protein n=1 Tax=Campylobacter TaxID=194 RepID=UPI000F7FF0A7|nr:MULTISPECIES: hypothetical protein [Campylobacter]ECK8147487.1 hypothetical protein [Campylobacter jejuni]ECL3200232.1 hypothetical protein [Campylobacter jejuni]ECP7312607.1 hypothetical protein [Campylobacter jejuni]ECP7611179.1 hypothetical protein [Campylobacter jejuni]ECQ1858540.1 hypothetical protein [Campylobacter jejuni]
MNCFKKLKEKIILIKIEKEKASEEKFLKECEIKEAEIRMEILEKRKDDLFKQREELIHSILDEASFNALTEERYLELINNYHILTEDNKANLYGILRRAYNLSSMVGHLKCLDKSINELEEEEEKQVEIIKTKKTNSQIKKERKMEKNAVEILSNIKTDELSNTINIIKVIEIENILNFKDLVDIFVNDKYKIEAKALKYLEVVSNKTEFFRTYLESKISKEFSEEEEKDYFGKFLKALEKGLDNLTGETEEERTKFKKHVKEIFEKIFNKKEGDENK